MTLQELMEVLDRTFVIHGDLPVVIKQHGVDNAGEIRRIVVAEDEDNPTQRSLVITFRP